MKYFIKLAQVIKSGILIHPYFYRNLTLLFYDFTFPPNIDQLTVTSEAVCKYIVALDTTHFKYFHNLQYF